MAWEDDEAMEEEYGGEMDASESEEEVVVGQMPTVMVPKHIKKRSLKNKALSVTLDEKALRDFVTGFHKRKKKRRKEAQKVLQEKERKRKIQERKRRKEEREIAMYGRVLSSENADADGLQNEGISNDDDEMETADASLSEIKTYEDGGTRITVTTSEITRDDDDLGHKPVSSVSTNYIKNPRTSNNSGLGVKKHQQKRKFKNKSKSKKGDKKRGAAKGKKKKGRK